MQKYKSNSKRVVEVRRSKGQWQFRVYRRENREIIASGERYVRKIDCIKTARLVTGGRLKISVIK